MGLLDRPLKAAQEGGRMGSVIEILVLQALAHQSLGDIYAALIPLHLALTLAEPEGYVRMFVDEGPHMALLLLEAAAHGSMPRQALPDYPARLLEALQPEQLSVLAVLGQEAKNKARPERNGGESARHSTSAEQSQIEPLSQRELELLRLFKTDLSGPEIARELMIALSTVRTHTNSIFSKLDVNNRRTAVKRAAELDLM
jgi:LuxR family transcriptional regulator, maltose regulon positive regulatory protein